MFCGAFRASIANDLLGDSPSDSFKKPLSKRRRHDACFENNLPSFGHSKRYDLEQIVCLDSLLSFAATRDTRVTIAINDAFSDEAHQPWRFRSCHTSAQQKVFSLDSRRILRLSRNRSPNGVNRARRARTTTLTPTLPHENNAMYFSRVTATRTERIQRTHVHIRSRTTHRAMTTWNSGNVPLVTLQWQVLG